MLDKALESGRCYVEDRGYAKFKLFHGIVAAQMLQHSGYAVTFDLYNTADFGVPQQRELGRCAGG